MAPAQSLTVSPCQSAMFSAALVLAVACKSTDDTASNDTTSCEPVEAWRPGTAAFREVTESWGVLGVEGIRLSVGDLDNDGWPDLLIRNGGGPEDFSEGGSRSRWVLRNNRSGGFEDVTESSGLLSGRLDAQANRPGQTFASGDVDNDGDLDVLVGTSRTDPSDQSAETTELMLNDGTGHFVLGPSQSDARFADIASNPAGVSFVDFDRDGLLDLWVTHNETSGPTPMQDRLCKGNGDGSFVDVTANRGLGTQEWNRVSTLNNARSHSWAWSGAACDLDNDGNPELLAASYGRAPNHLWAAQDDDGVVAFENHSIDSGYAFDHRVDWSDDRSAQCYCADNPSAEDCDTVPEADSSLCDSMRAAFGENYRWDHNYSREPFRLGGNSGTTVCADLDNDGYQDLLTHEIVHWDVGSSSDPSEILWNTGESPPYFERPGNEATGLLREDAASTWDHGDMTGAVLDFDNDGWLDIYIGASDYTGNRGLLYHQVAPLEFEAVNPGDFFEHYRSHGVTTADIDRDGDEDIVVGHSRMRCGDSGECNETQQIRIFENTVGQDSPWIQLLLEGTGGSNTMAVGARVELRSEGVTQTRVVGGGHGHFGMQKDRLLSFGIGSTCAAQVTIHWPDAQLSVSQYELEPFSRYHITQGKDPERTD